MTQDKNISYLNKDFNDFRNSLINYAKTYFPNTYNDFSPASPGMMFMEMSSYVGDILSFYLDNQFQENLLLYAKEKENVMALAYTLGYRPKASYASSTDIDIYQLLPAKSSGGNLVPNYTYALVFPENTAVKSTSTNSTFLITEEVDFSNTGSIDISLIDGTNYFLAKKSVSAISGEVKTATFSFGTPEKFASITLNDSNILQILNVTGSDGSIWYEVPYLAQETIYDSIKNTNVNDPNNSLNAGDTPYLLQLKKVQRRFVTRFLNSTNLQLQFGAGTAANSDEEITPNPDNVGIGLPSRQTKMTTAYDPSNFLFTGTYGIAPSNTTLTVTYLVGGGINSNQPSNTITQKGFTVSDITFNNFIYSSNPSLGDTLFSSLTFNRLYFYIKSEFSFCQ